MLLCICVFEFCICVFEFCICVSARSGRRPEQVVLAAARVRVITRRSVQKQKEKLLFVPTCNEINPDLIMKEFHQGILFHSQ